MEAADPVAELPGGGQVSYAVHGDPGGAPLVFFHGWPSSRMQGILCDEAAKAHGFRVITPDRPGIGGTPFQPGRRLADWPGFLDRFLEAIGIGGKISILGVSGGAPYVYATAHAMPDRLTSAGVLSGAVPLIDFPDKREMILPYRALLLARRRSPWLLKAGIRLGQRAAYWPPHHPGMRLLSKFIPGEDRGVIRENLVRDQAMSSYRLAVANGPGPLIADGDIYTERWNFDLEDVTAPIHLWHGEADRNIPASMARVVGQRLPRSVERYFPDEGHYSLSANAIGELIERLRG